MTLTEFLLARIAEDEAVARAASQTARDGSMAQWRDECRDGGNPGQSRVWNGVGQAVVSHAYHDQGPHIARFDPVRVLAECEAKRRIVEDWGKWQTYNGEELMQELALPYASHPDYQNEWRP